LNIIKGFHYSWALNNLVNALATLEFIRSSPSCSHFYFIYLLRIGL